MIAMIDVDPRDPNRFFVAALGHPYGPNAERGMFRSTDGGKTFQKVLYKDEYTSANDVPIDPGDPNTVYAALWMQQQSYIEGGAFGTSGGDGGIFKSTDGGTTWKQADRRLARSCPGEPRHCTERPEGDLRDGGARAGAGGGPRRRWWRRPAARAVAASGSTSRPTAASTGSSRSTTRTRRRARRHAPRTTGRWAASAAATCRRSRWIRRTRTWSTAASTVFWRTEDGGLTWSAVRGAPGGDDYQKAWVNPNNPDILLVVTDQGGVVSANRGASWSNWYTQPTAAMYHVTTDNAFPYRVCGGQQDSGSACVDSRVERRRDHVPRLASRRHPGVRRGGARPEEPRSRLRRLAQQRLAVQPEDGPDVERGRPRPRPAIHPQRAHDADRVVAHGPEDALLCAATRCSRRATAGRTGRASAATWRARRGRCRRARASTRAR